MPNMPTPYSRTKAAAFTDTATLIDLTGRAKSVTLSADSACWIDFYQTAVTNGSFLLPANVPTTFDITFPPYVSVVRDTASGLLSILEAGSVALFDRHIAFFSANASLKRVRTNQLDADANLKKTVLNTATGNSNLKRLAISYTFTSSSKLKRVIPGTATADASLKAVVAATATANSNLKGTVSGTATSNASLLATVSATVTSDSNLLATVAANLTGDCHLDV